MEVIVSLCPHGGEQVIPYTVEGDGVGWDGMGREGEKTSGSSWGDFPECGKEM